MFRSVTDPRRDAKAIVSKLPCSGLRTSFLTPSTDEVGSRLVASVPSRVTLERQPSKRVVKRHLRQRLGLSHGASACVAFEDASDEAVVLLGLEALRILQAITMAPSTPALPNSRPSGIRIAWPETNIMNVAEAAAHSPACPRLPLRWPSHLNTTEPQSFHLCISIENPHFPPKSYHTSFQ